MIIEQWWNNDWKGKPKSSEMSSNQATTTLLYHPELVISIKILRFLWKYILYIYIAQGWLLFSYQRVICMLTKTGWMNYLFMKGLCPSSVFRIFLYCMEEIIKSPEFVGVISSFFIHLTCIVVKCVFWCYMQCAYAPPCSRYSCIAF
jgi:hypothetical protein